MKILLQVGSEDQSSLLLTSLMNDHNEKATASRIADLEKQLQRAKEELQVARMRNKEGGEGAASAFPVKSSIYDKGFNPIFVYSNSITAAAEIPIEPHYA